MCAHSQSSLSPLLSTFFQTNNTSPYYSQCLPGTAPSSPTPPTTGTATPTVSGGTGSTSFPGTTLQSGYYWIRAVESPNFHQYLQTSPEYVPGTAILDDYTSAGQFQVVNGQLVELTQGGLLYGNVEVQENSTVTKSVTPYFASCSIVAAEIMS
jgi:hypothetical protein